MPLPSCTDRVKRVIPPIEWPVFAEDIDAILELKRERNAVILAHNYQTPEIFHCVADIVGDSLALAREAMTRRRRRDRARRRAFHGRDGEAAEPGQDRADPRPARRLLAGRVDHRRRRARCCAQRYPGVPVVTYVNTSAAVKAESDICCTSGNARKVVEILGVPTGDHAARTSTWRRTSPPRPRSKIIAWAGHCEVHERFTAGRHPRAARRAIPGVIVLAHPECPPEVVAEADFAGSTAAMADYVGAEAPARVVLMTECSMSDNVAVQYPDSSSCGPCNLCPHMKRITLAEYPPRARDDDATR